MATELKPPKGGQPVIRELPRQHMAVVETLGDPNQQQAAFSSLYGTVYALKFQLKKAGRDFKMGAPRARWPDAHLKPKEQWTGLWALPIPEGIDEQDLPQKEPRLPVRVEDWEYGTVAELLHVGPYTTEGPTIAALHRFIEESGYEIAGSHEEEYLTSPHATKQKTRIRYPVRRRTAG